jgi:GT2 family glycosyltransferase
MKAFGSFITIGMLTGPGRAIARLLNGKNVGPGISENLILPDWISGSVIMIKSTFFKELGGFDEDFFMYFEDMDLCNRARRLGSEIFYFTNITIRHNHGGSSRINSKISAITKTEVAISGHIYISKHLEGFRKVLAQILLVINNLVFGIINALFGIVLFFKPKLFVKTMVLAMLARYYIFALLRKTWRSPRSINYLKVLKS